MTRVLVCDDEPQILRALRIVLRGEGFEVSATATFEEALDEAALRPPDAAILDLVLPDGDGVELTRRLREWTAAPILLLSAVGDETSKIEALDAGADDYVTKPFSPPELLARLRAALRRAAPAGEASVMTAGELAVDLAARSVTREGEEVRLTKTEYELLRMLISNRGRLLTHRAMLIEVWGPAYADDVAVLRTHMANVRRKIGHGPIRTESGVGYRFTG